jgi:hypothetical protein
MVGRQERRYPHSHAGDGQLSGHLVLAIPKGGSCRERRCRRSTWGAFVTLTADCIAELVWWNDRVNGCPIRSTSLAGRFDSVTE